MKIRRLLCAIIAVITITSAFAFMACGKKDPIDENDPLSGVKITVGIANNASERAILNTFRTAYLKKYPTRKVETNYFSNNFDNDLANRVNSKKVPDVVQVYDFSAEYWTSKGVFTSLDDLMEKDGIKESDYFESIIDMTKSGTDGKKYWVARDYNKTVIAINKEMFEVAGVALPNDNWTWEEFVSTCEALEAQKTKIMAHFGQEIFYAIDANLNWEAVYYPAIKSYGGDLFDTTNNTALKNLDGVKEGLGKWANLVAEGLAVNPSDASSGAFAGKQTAMQIVVRPNVTSLANNIKDANGDSRLDFVAMPTFTDDNVETSYIGVGCTGYALSSFSTGKQAEAAWEFMKFIISEEGQEAFSKSGAGIPALKDMALDENATYRTFLPDANHSAFVKFMDRDLSMNYLHGTKVNNHLNIRSTLQGELMKNLVNAKDLTAYYNTLKSKLESAMK